MYSGYLNSFEFTEHVGVTLMFYKNEHVCIGSMVVMRLAGADCRCISRRGPEFGPGKKPIIYSQHFPTSCLLLPSLRLFIVNTVSSIGVISLFFWQWRLQIHRYRGLEEIVLRLESWMHSENKIIVFWSYQLYVNLLNNYC